MSAAATQGGHKKLLRLSCNCWKKFAFGKENNRLCPNSLRSILALGADPRKIWRYSTRPLNFSHQQSRNACTVYGCASLYMLSISKLWGTRKRIPSPYHSEISRVSLRASSKCVQEKFNEHLHSSRSNNLYLFKSGKAVVTLTPTSQQLLVFKVSAIYRRKAIDDCSIQM